MAVIKAKDGAIISYSDQGSGLPLLFLHGWMMSKKVWHFQLPLSGVTGIRVITMDLRGHGGSTAAEFSYDACIRDLEALLDHLGIKNVVIVGWSMGAQIAIKAYPLLKERISALILVGGTSCFCSREDYTGGLAAKEARGMAIRLKRDYKGTSGHFFKSMFSAEETARTDLGNIAARTVANLPALQISLSALNELTDNDLRALLPEIKLPVLIIHGAGDSICPLGAAEFMADHLPLNSLRIFAASGHAPFLSAAEKFNSELTAFIRTLNGRD